VREWDPRHRGQPKAAEHDRYEPGEEEQIDDTTRPPHPPRAAAARILEHRGLEAIGRGFPRVHRNVSEYVTEITH
jgi:hypothetical protein